MILPLGFIGNAKPGAYIGLHPYVLVKTKLFLVFGTLISDLKPIAISVNAVIGDYSAITRLFFVAGKQKNASNK
jgi:hypothetical protein